MANTYAMGTNKKKKTERNQIVGMFSLLAPVRRNWRGKSSHKSVRVATAAGSLTSWTDPSCWYRPTPTSLALHLLFPSSSFGYNSNDSDPHVETRYRGGPAHTHTRRTFCLFGPKKKNLAENIPSEKETPYVLPNFLNETRKRVRPALLRAKEKKKKEEEELM